MSAKKIVVLKNKDYAENDSPFKNFRMSEQVGVDPARAILVRISDKLSRISNLLDREGGSKRREDWKIVVLMLLIILPY